MTGLCDFCGHPLAYLNHDDCNPEGEAARESDRCLTQPGGKTGAGDPWCGDCRRARREEDR